MNLRLILTNNFFNSLKYFVLKKQIRELICDVQSKNKTKILEIKITRNLLYEKTKHTHEFYT